MTEKEKKETLEKLAEEKEVVSKVIYSYQDKLRRINKSMALLSCPFSEGDTIRQGDQLAKVERIEYAGNENRWSMCIRKIKKNGEPYSRVSYPYWNEKWEKEE